MRRRRIGSGGTKLAATEPRSVILASQTESARSVLGLPGRALTWAAYLGVRLASAAARCRAAEGPDGLDDPWYSSRSDEALGGTWSYLDITALGRQESWEDSPDGYPQARPYAWWN